MLLAMTAPLEEATREPAFEVTQRFELLVKAMQPALKASQPAEPRQVSEKRPEQAKLARLETAPVV